MRTKVNVDGLSKKQQRIIVDLLSGGALITSSEMTGAMLSIGDHPNAKEYKIGHDLFWDMYNRNIFYQETSRPFNYHLSHWFLKEYSLDNLPF